MHQCTKMLNVLNVKKKSYESYENPQMQVKKLLPIITDFFNTLLSSDLEVK